MVLVVDIVEHGGAVSAVVGVDVVTGIGDDMKFRVSVFPLLQLPRTSLDPCSSITIVCYAMVSISSIYSSHQ